MYRHERDNHGADFWEWMRRLQNEVQLQEDKMEEVLKRQPPGDERSQRQPPGEECPQRQPPGEEHPQRQPPGEEQPGEERPQPSRNQHPRTVTHNRQINIPNNDRVKDERDNNDRNDDISNRQHTFEASQSTPEQLRESELRRYPYGVFNVNSAAESTRPPVAADAFYSSAYMNFMRTHFSHHTDAPVDQRAWPEILPVKKEKDT